MRDPYAVLGVARDADADTIRKAYRKLAREYHPDVNQAAGAEERFKEISQAYDILGDEEKRRMFDRYGEDSTRAGFDPNRAAGFGGFGGGGFPGAAEGVDLEDLFGSFFGERIKRGRNVRLGVRIDPDIAILGGEITVQVPDPAGPPRPTRVRVPAGVTNGGKLRLRGQGPPPRGGGPCGDLLLELTVPDHPLYKRLDDDLEIEVPITVLEGLKGARIQVPTPTGAVKLSVPERTTQSRRLRVRGKGVQKKGVPGDLYVVLRPTLPDQVDESVLKAARVLEAAYATPIRQGLTD